MTLRSLVFIAYCVVFLAGNAFAQTGEDAFDARDYPEAIGRLRAEAEDGSAEAMLQLGTMTDLGLGVARDPAQALRWYMAAAGAGLADAQFNVGVMLDAGVERPRDAAAAAAWYARAAANGHARAQYNLGILYASGDGVPQNNDLSRYWLELASGTLSAAQDRLSATAVPSSAMRVWQAPQGLSAGLVERNDRRRVELVWSSPPIPPTAAYLVELRTYGTTMAVETAASALSLDLADGQSPQAWRVSLIDREEARYASSPWQSFASAVPALREGHQITLRVGKADSAARYLALQLRESFMAADLLVTLETMPVPPDITKVSYAFDEDAGFAAEVAAFLPGAGGVAASASSEVPTAPGAIVVQIVGGPDTP